MSYLIQLHTGELHFVECRSLEFALRQIEEPEKGFEITPVNRFTYEDGRVDHEDLEELEDQVRNLEYENSKLKELNRVFDIQGREMETWLTCLGYDYFDPSKRPDDDKDCYEDAVEYARNLALKDQERENE